MIQLNIENLKQRLTAVMERKYNTIGDPEKNLQDESVIHAVQDLNGCIQILREIADLENMISREVTKIAEEIDKL